MMAHHTCNGCNLQPGDLLGTGTISGPDGRAAAACWRPRRAARTRRLASGEERRFLEDGDEVILRARAAARALPRSASANAGERCCPRWAAPESSVVRDWVIRAPRKDLARQVGHAYESGSPT